MNKLIPRNIIRIIFILILQVLILRRIDINIGGFNYLHLLVYPIVILLLPIRLHKILVLLISFFFGLMLDMFYNSPGIHAGALVFMAYIRTFVLQFIEPSEGYKIDTVPTIDKMGFTWWLVYGSLLLFIHHLTYFSLEAFSYVYILEILLRTIFSFLASFILMILLMFLTNPKY